MAEKQKITLVPGESYKGHGGVNEYGETWFTPSQSMPRDGNMKRIKEVEDISLYESANFVKIAITIDKKLNTVETIKYFMKAFQRAVVELKKYKTD